MIAKIVKITDQEGKPKTDGRYPMRVGAIVDVYPVKVGDVLYMDLIADGAGNLKNGMLVTSMVQAVEIDKADDFIEADGVMKVTTRNSVYYLEQRPKSRKGERKHADK